MSIDVTVQSEPVQVTVAGSAATVVETTSGWPNAFAPVVNVRTFGAKGDGTTNDSVALQKAWDAAYQSGVPAWHPPGLYRAVNLRPNPGNVLLGPNGGGHGILLDSSRHAYLANIAGTNDHLIRGVQGVAHVVMQGLHLDGNKNNNLTSGSAIYLDDVGTAEEAQWRIEGCFIEAAREYGVYVGVGRRAVKISNKCVINYHGQSGVRWSGSDGRIDGCIVGSNLVDGIQVGTGVTRITNCDIYGNTNNGIDVLSTIQQVIIGPGNGIDRNGTNGIFLASSTQAIAIVGNDLHSNSQTTNGGAHHINVKTTTGKVTISNNVFGVDSGMTKAAGYCIFKDTGATYVGDGALQTNVMVTGASNLGLTN